MEIEITKEVVLTEQEGNLLDMHSFLNVMNVLLGELQVLDMEFGDEGLLTRSIGNAEKILDSMPDPEKAIMAAGDIDKFEHSFLEDLRGASMRFPQLVDENHILESVENIESIISILKVRAGEWLERIDNPERWIDHNIEELKHKLTHVLAAIEKNSKGKYRIVYNVAEQEQRDYVVDLNINSMTGDIISLPPVFQDTMRDLIANARKYTEPGGRISAGLWDDGNVLRLVVEDTGKGIPEDEMEEVVNFGYRGSNISDKETQGGGFGLTKAYINTRRFGGRMWIRSGNNSGTRITIEVPRKQNDQ